MNIKSEGEGLDGEMEITVAHWRRFHLLWPIIFEMCCFFTDNHLNQIIWPFSSLTYFHITEANSVLHVLISLGKGASLHNLKPFLVLFILTNMLHGLLPGFCRWQESISVKCLENSYCDAKEITTAVDFSSCCQQRFVDSDSCCLLVSFPLTKISVHQARDDEEDINERGYIFPNRNFIFRILKQALS